MRNAYPNAKILAMRPFSGAQAAQAQAWVTSANAGGFGKPLIAIEPTCKGKGDACCEWKIQPPEAWGDEAKVYLEAKVKLAMATKIPSTKAATDPDTEANIRILADAIKLLLGKEPPAV